MGDYFVYCATLDPSSFISSHSGDIATVVNH